MRGLHGTEGRTVRLTQANTIEELTRCLERVEFVDNDGRHGIGAPWIVARGWTRAAPPQLPGRVYIGEPQASYFRRFYCHPSGWVAEGGRGGARLFYAGDAPHPFIGAFESTSTRIRTRSIRDAVAIVEALERRPWWKRWWR